MPTDCRVRRLHIRTQDKAFVPHMMFVLEDALRTASFPGIPPNGMVYFRRLDLGEHDSSVSRRVLAKKIDDLLHHVRPVKLTENVMEQLAAPAVWFPDELTPYRFMIRLLSKNHRPLAWYWPSAIRGWSPKLTVNQSYHLILSQVSKHSTGMRGMSCVVEPLLNTQTLHEVINTFDPEDMSLILMNMDLKPVYDFKMFSDSRETSRKQDADSEMETPLPVTSQVCDSIIKAVRMWSVFDPRTTFFACLALAHMGKKTSMFQVNRLLESVAELQSEHREMQDRASGNGHEAAKVRGMSGREKQLSDVAKEINNSVPDYSEIERILAAGSDAEKKRPIHQEAEMAHGENGQVNRLSLPKMGIETQETEKKAGKVSDKDHAEKIEQARFSRTEKRHLQNQKDLQTVIFEPQRSYQGGKNEQRKLEVKPSFAFKEHGLPEYRPLFGGFAGELSGYAGLVFLVPLMKRLGMDFLFETYPEYDDLKLATRILFRFAELLGISDDDPVLQFLGEKPKASMQPIAFTAPVQWRKILYPSPSEAITLKMCRVMGMRGRRLLLDNKGRLVVGLWHPGNRGLLDPWFEKAQKPFQQSAPQSWTLNRVVDNFVLAMNRYVKRYAAMGLISLIKRPAYIATTKTHLDVTIPFSQLNIRVRIGGLDINPGWVPWLGRVIQFHYVGGES